MFDRPRPVRVCLPCSRLRPPAASVVVLLLSRAAAVRRVRSRSLAGCRSALLSSVSVSVSGILLLGRPCSFARSSIGEARQRGRTDTMHNQGGGRTNDARRRRATQLQPQLARERLSSREDPGSSIGLDSDEGHRQQQSPTSLRSMPISRVRCSSLPFR